MEYWSVAIQTRGGKWDNIFIMSHFDKFKLAQEFYESKMKELSLQKDTDYTYRLFCGRLHDSAYVKVVNNKIVK